jgi:outer membrane protein TolC
VDVILTERALFRTRRDYARARYNYLLDTLRLKLAAGTLTGGTSAPSTDSWNDEARLGTSV